MIAIVDILVYLMLFSVLCILGVFLLILFTTGFKQTGRLTGGLYCLTAPPSNGKTFVVTSFAIDFMRKGRRVFTNYPIVYRNGREEYISKVLTKEMLLSKNMNGSVIIVDEAHRWFWSRKFKEFTEEYKDWFSTLAQHGISLYYVVQHEDRVDTIINDCCNLFGEIQKTEIPLLEMPLYFTVTWWNREIELQLSRTNASVEPYHQEKVWFDRNVAFSFDTCWFGHDKRPEYKGINWIKYLKTKGVEYGGNYNYPLKTIFFNIFYYKIYIPLLNKLHPMTKSVEKIWSEIGKRFDRDHQEDYRVGYVGCGNSSGNESVSQLLPEEKINSDEN